MKVEIDGDIFILPFWVDEAGDVRDSSDDDKYIVYQHVDVINPNKKLGEYITAALNEKAAREAKSDERD